MLLKHNFGELKVVIAIQVYLALGLQYIVTSFFHYHPFSLPPSHLLGPPYKLPVVLIDYVKKLCFHIRYAYIGNRKHVSKKTEVNYVFLSMFSVISIT